MNSKTAAEKLKAEGIEINDKNLYTMMHSDAAPIPAFPGTNHGTNHKQQQPVNTPKLEGETEAQYIERLTADYKKRTHDALPPALAARAVSFIKAMASKVFEPPASEEMQAARLNTCYSCEHFLLSLEIPEHIGHCKACGCNMTSKLTSLATKSKILLSSCPKGFWDVSISAAPSAEPSFSRRAE